MSIPGKHPVAFVLAVLLVLAAVLFAPSAVAFDLPEPDHGVEDDFDKLWSKHTYDGSPSDTVVGEFVSSTDYFYAEPPEAPDEWNRGEAAEFDGGGDDASVYPEGTELEQGDSGLLNDAYIRFFAAEPSTVFPDLPEPEEGDADPGGGQAPSPAISDGSNGTVLAPAEDGTVHGFFDYRVEDADSHEAEIYLFNEGETTLSEVIEGDGNPVWSRTSSGGGSFAADYDRLGRGPLNMTAVITAEREVVDGNDTVDTVVVSDTVELQRYDMSDRDIGAPPAVGRLGAYPNGDTALFLGFLVSPVAAWSSVTLSDGSTVHSNWRFFSARDTDWDSFSASSQAGVREHNESYHPLRVHAYPSIGGLYTDGDAEAEAIGPARQPPDIDDSVSVDLPDTNFTLPQQLDLRYSTSPDGDTRISGLVAGTSAEPQISPRITEIRETNLRVGVVDEDEDSVEVAVSLRDDDGQPIDTRGGDGYIRVAGHGNVTTGLDGSTTLNVSPKPAGGVFAEYVPEDWYETGEGQPAYLGDTATAPAGTEYEPFAELGMLAQVAAFLAPLLILVFMLDRMLGLGIWPPWRKI